MATPANSLPTLTPADLQDPTLFRLNNILQLYFGKTANIYQPGITTTLGADLVVPSITASDQAMVPTDPDTLITLATAQALFGASSTRQVLTTSQNTTSEQVVQPINTSSGSSSSGTGLAITIIYTLSSNTSIPAPATSPTGTMYKIKVTQNSTGGYTISWASVFKLASVDITPYANKSTIFSFTRFSDGNLWADSNPVREV